MDCLSMQLTSERMTPSDVVTQRVWWKDTLQEGRGGSSGTGTVEALTFDDSTAGVSRWQALIVK